MIRDFDNWNNNIGEAASLEELKGLRVAIEAADYLQNRILKNPRASEPLVPALGGLPLCFRPHIEDDLRSFASLGIQPLFIFSGLDLTKPEDPFQQRLEGALVNRNAWALYDQHNAEESVEKFRESSYVTPEDLFRALQSVLLERGVPFFVAPYSAWAQLAYLERHGEAAAVAGSSNLLLFGCTKVITGWEFDTNQFKFTSRNGCISDIKKFVGNPDISVSEDQLVDACLLAGSPFLPTLPILELNPRNKVLKPLGAIDMIINGPRSGISVVLNNEDEPRMKQMEYADKYRKARLAVKHHPVLTAEGKIEPAVESQLPNDAHEFIGQRLPDEIYHYLSKGLISARILNWRAGSEIIESPPVDGGDSLDYHTLVSSKLTPLRTSAINLLSSALHNWYQHKDMTLRCWFPDPAGIPQTSTISMRGLPESRRIVETWNVKEETFKGVVAQTQTKGCLGSAILALKDEIFVSKSSSKKDANKPLSTTDEILYNSIWRFLALREYVDVNHSLTAWGKVLASVIAGLKGNAELEEAAVIAVELLRLGILNAENMFQYNGAPMRGDSKDKSFNLLISRVAGLGILHHKPIGFTGPLSQHLLGYNSMINAVRSTVRDLIEVSSTHLFIGGFAKRDIDNLSSIALKLPFLLSNNCALSIAVKSYLDEVVANADPTSPETKAAVLETASTRYFPQSEDFVGDLKTAFALWDAVFEGVKGSGNLIKDSEKKFWGEADGWLGARR